MLRQTDRYAGHRNSHPGNDINSTQTREDRMRKRRVESPAGSRLRQRTETPTTLRLCSNPSMHQPLAHINPTIDYCKHLLGCRVKATRFKVSTIRIFKLRDRLLETWLTLTGASGMFGRAVTSPASKLYAHIPSRPATPQSQKTHSCKRRCKGT